MQCKGATVARAPNGQEEPSGYVAVGAFSKSGKSIRNFVVPSDNVKPDGSIAANTIISARWSVYLRANTNSTEEGSNAILGLVNEGACLKVLRSFPGARGQAWAAVKLVDCPGANA